MLEFQFNWIDNENNLNGKFQFEINIFAVISIVFVAR